jgi:hypothetical protein
LVDAAEVKFLPLVAAERRTGWRPGWVTYNDGFDNNPDVEVFCGGENEKSAAGAACWRQGNLLHFGFEQDPSELNEEGRRLLLNSIAYISAFKEDRPIAVTPSVFAGRVGLPRTYLDRRMRGKADRSELKWMITPALFDKVTAMDAAQLKKWYDENRGFLHPGESPERFLEVDEQARKVGAPFDELSFFERCIAKLGESEVAEVLHRYAPVETEKLKTSAEWSQWLKENKDYLFFSDQGDYRWYVDPLAKKRHVPSAALRGPARASK